MDTKFLIIPFLVIMLVFLGGIPDSLGHGLGSETMPPVMIGDMEATLEVNSFTNYVDVDGKEIGIRQISINFFESFTSIDSNKVNPINNVTFQVELIKGGTVLINETFQRDDGILIMNLTPSNNKQVKVLEHETVASFFGLASEQYNFEGEIFENGGLYEFKISVLSINSYDNVLSDPVDYELGISIEETTRYEINDVNYGKQELGIVTFFDQITDFEYNTETKEIIFSFPFEWNQKTIDQTTVIHEEVLVPKTFGDLLVAKYVATLNGLKLPESMVNIDDFSADDRLVHIVVSQKELQEIFSSNQFNNNIITITVKPQSDLPLSGITENGQFKIELWWDGELKSGESTVFYYYVLDTFLKDRPIAVPYDLKIFHDGKEIGKKSGISTDEKTDGELSGYRTAIANTFEFFIPSDVSGIISVKFENLDESKLGNVEFPVIIDRRDSISTSYQIPDWVKNTAGWWATDAISESEFVNAIEFLIKDGIIEVSASQSNTNSQGVPSWVKNTAGWWATDAISESEFVNAIEFLIKDGIIEVESNGSLFNSVTECVYGKHPLFEDMSSDVKLDLCNSKTHDSKFLGKHWRDTSTWHSIQRIDEERGLIYYNNEGFRSKDFETEKPDDVYRIFAVGGSTTYGNGVHDSETWPAYLQEIFDNLELDFTVEVINAGIPGSKSDHEVKLVKESLMEFHPDMILVLDGVNDWRQTSPELWAENWIGVCKIGQDIGFETVIVVQPMVNTGQRELSIQDKIMVEDHKIGDIDTYKLHEYLDELEEHCTATSDFRNIFDKVPEPVFFDGAHTFPVGNKIIADNFFSLISPLIKFDSGNDAKIINDSFVLYPKTKSEFFKTSDYQETESPSISLRGINLHAIWLKELDFADMDLEYSSFYNSRLEKMNFENSIITNSDFRYSMSNSPNFKNADLTKSKFFNTQIIAGDFSNADLRMTSWALSITMNSDFSGVDFKDADLSYAVFENCTFTGTNFSNSSVIMTAIKNSKLNNSNFENSNFQLTKFHDNSMLNVNFENAQLSSASLAGNDLRNSIFTNADLRNAYLYNSNLAGANLAGANLEGADLEGANLEGANLEGANLNCIGHSICS